MSYLYEIQVGDKKGTFGFKFSFAIWEHRNGALHGKTQQEQDLLQQSKLHDTMEEAYAMTKPIHRCSRCTIPIRAIHGTVTGSTKATKVKLASVSASRSSIPTKGNRQTT